MAEDLWSTSQTTGELNIKTREKGQTKKTRDNLINQERKSP